MSDTPRTDAEARMGAYLKDGDYASTCGHQHVHIDFARTLERENQQLRAEMDELKSDSIKTCELLNTLEEAATNITALKADMLRVAQELILIRDTAGQPTPAERWNIYREAAQRALDILSVRVASQQT